MTLKKACAPLLLFGLWAPALVTCDGLSKVATVASVDCSALKDGNFAALKLDGDAKVQAQLKGFLESVYTLRTLTVDVEKDLIGACADLGKAIGVDEGTLKADPGDGDGAKKVCGTVAENVKAMIEASGGYTLELQISEPRCEIDVEAQKKCFEECGSPMKAGELAAACTEGELTGKCDSECTGTCFVDGTGKCNGGICTGKCEGFCDGKKSPGVCPGKCMGKCSGACGMQGKGTCEGECTACSVDVKAPKCSGTFKPPSVDLACQMSCASKLSNTIQCSLPTVVVTIKGKGKLDLGNLQKGLEAALPKIMNIGKGRAKNIVATAQGLKDYGTQLPDIAKQAGVQGGVCLAQAAEMTAGAVGAIKVEVDVSVSVSASVNGGASVSAKGG